MAKWKAQAECEQNTTRASGKQEGSGYRAEYVGPRIGKQRGWKAECADCGEKARGDGEQRAVEVSVH